MSGENFIIDGKKDLKIVKTLFYYYAFICFGMFSGLIGPSMPYLSELVNTNLDKISFILIAKPAGTFIGTALTGYFYDNYKGHIIFSLSLLILGVGMLLVPNSSSLRILLLLFLIMGIAEGFGHVGGNTLLIWNYNQKTGGLINGLHSCHGLGAFLSPFLLGIFLSNNINQKWTFWIVTLLVLPVFLFINFLESPKNSLIEVEKNNIKKENSYKLIALFFMFLFIVVGFEISFGSWIYTYATTKKLLIDNQAAYLTSTFFGTMTIGRIIIIPFTKKVSFEKIVFFSLLISIVFLGLVLVFPESSMFLWIVTIIVGLSISTLFPATLSLAENKLNISGKLTSLFLIGATLGAMILPWTIGQLIHFVDMKIFIYAIVAILFNGLLLFLVLNSESRRSGKKS